MRIHGLILGFGVLAMLPGLPWPAPGWDLDGILSAPDPDSDPFGEFLRKSRLSEDSLQYQLGRQALARERVDSALGHHLAVTVPASGTFRDTLLAQRSRIFARLWPATAPPTGGKDPVAEDTPANDSTSGTGKPEFAWGMGTHHSRGVFRTGEWQPDGWRSRGFENRDWMYQTFARQTWPISIRRRVVNLAASVNQSTAGAYSTLDAAVEAHVPEGIFGNLELVLSGGRRKSLEWGAYQSYDLLASKAWYFEGARMGLQAGFSREWNADGERMNDHAWISLRRDIPFAGGSGLAVSLDAAFDRRDPQYQWITTSVLYVDDVSKPHPTHFRAPDFRDTLHGNAGEGLLRFAEHAGALQLAAVAPRSYLSLGPSLRYGFSLPAGFGAMAGASYALDIYRESTWDWVPTPDSLDLAGADMVGLAFNRADGRYYAAAFAEQDGEIRETYGVSPWQRRKAQRRDHRIGMSMSVWRTLPHGYTLSLESSAGFGWSNLSRASPIGSQPWQWGLSFQATRSATW